MNIAIFGAGPAGLAAAHAAYLSGAYAVLFSYGRKSDLHGCQYLHEELPDLGKLPKRRVDYSLWGTPEQYRDKVYGSLWDGKVSPQDLEGSHWAWDIRTAYNRLWALYGDGGPRASHYRETITARWIRDNMGKLLDFDHIISTIPMNRICPVGHDFLGNSVWAMGDALDGSQQVPYYCADDSIVCNGLDEPAWYRLSRVFGVTTVEWPGRIKPPLPGVAAVTKPLYTNCDCFPQIKRMGRYGAWKKDQLVHNVFNQTMELLKK